MNAGFAEQAHFRKHANGIRKELDINSTASLPFYWEMWDQFSKIIFISLCSGHSLMSHERLLFQSADWCEGITGKIMAENSPEWGCDEQQSEQGSKDCKC